MINLRPRHLKTLIIAEVLAVFLIAILWWWRSGPSAIPPEDLPTRADLGQLEAFTADSYGAYLDAFAMYEQGRASSPPNPAAYLRTFTLHQAAERASREGAEPENWWGSVATYTLEGDSTPSTWIIRTTLSGDLEGIPVLSDTDNPL